MLCAEKKLEYDLVKEQLIECGAPGTKDKKVNELKINLKYN